MIRSLIMAAAWWRSGGRVTAVSLFARTPPLLTLSPKIHVGVKEALLLCRGQVGGWGGRRARGGQRGGGGGQSGRAGHLARDGAMSSGRQHLLPVSGEPRNETSLPRSAHPLPPSPARWLTGPACGGRGARADPFGMGAVLLVSDPFPHYWGVGGGVLLFGRAHSD